MFNGRLYRAAFVPVLAALAVVAFSLSARPGPLSSSLAPDAFEGQRAYEEMRHLAAEFPSRAPGSSGDDALAERVAHTIEALGGTAGGGFKVHFLRLRAHTVDSERELDTVVASRPGSGTAGPIVVLAHRDSTQRGAAAQLSGTAEALELARVFASRETHRPIVIVSTSGGSGGDVGAQAFAHQAASLVHAPIDAVIVLGDVASSNVSAPVVVPYSDGYGSAPDELQRTVNTALTREAGIHPGSPSALGEFVHLAFPLAPGEQGALGAAGLPAVLVQLSGERGPSAHAAVSEQRMEAVGRATLTAMDALDAAPAIETRPQTGIVLSRQIVPAWALRLLIGALLIPPLVVLVDGLARARRRHEPASRWVLWALSCALPFFACAVCALVLGALGAAPAIPFPALGEALPLNASAASAVLALVLVLVLSWLVWPPLVRRLGLLPLPTREGAAAALAALARPGRERRRGAATNAPSAPLGVRVGASPSAPVGSASAPSEPASSGVDTAGMATMLLALGLAFLVWLKDPYAALLMVLGLHLMLLVASPEWRPRPLVGLGLLALSLLPLALVIAFYAHQLGYGIGGVAWAGVLLVAGGQVGFVAVLAWSVAFGCCAAMALVAVAPPADPDWVGPAEAPEISIRGPLTYAGPGSLGGTGSALRR
jgi:Peptidase family M28